MCAMTIRQLQEGEVSFTVVVSAEDLVTPEEVFDTASSTDDERQCAREIRARLDAGEAWAWCCVKVTAEWRGFRGENFLGECSYDDQEDFEGSGYYVDMKREALDELNASVRKAFESISELILL